MIELYFLDKTFLFFMFLIAFIVGILHIIFLATIMLFRAGFRKLQIATEIAIVPYLCVVIAFPMVCYFYGNREIININYYTTVFYVLAIAPLVLSLIQVVRGDLVYVLSIISIFMTLPLAEIGPYGTYAFSYTFAVIPAGGRILYLLSKETYFKQKAIDKNSIQQGIDRLQVGIMYFDTQGYIYLINEKMLEIMDKYCGKEQRNGVWFWDYLLTYNDEKTKSRVIQNDVLLQGEKETIRFSKNNYIINNMTYSEVIGTDVTEIGHKLSELEKENVNLRKQEEELEILWEDKAKIRKEREYATLRAEVHDIMGQRFSSLQRTLQGVEDDNYETVIPALKELMRRIKADEDEGNLDIPELKARKLKNDFAKIKLKINYSGSFPSDEKLSKLFLKIIREAGTNAINHADATILNVEISSDPNNYILRVENNGEQFEGDFIPGSGIVELIEATEENNGMLKVEPEKNFTITAIVKNREQ